MSTKQLWVVMALDRRSAQGNCVGVLRAFETLAAALAFSCGRHTVRCVEIDGNLDEGAIDGQYREPWIVVDVKNAILGDGEFWSGPVSRIAEIRNIPARMTAEKVAGDGVPRSCGMWRVRREAAPDGDHDG